MEIIAQIIGLIAVAIYLFSYQQKKRSNILLLNVASRGLFILQYALLGAFAGAVLDVLGAISTVIAGQKHTEFVKKHIKVIVIAVNVVTIAIGVLMAVLNQSWLDLFSLTGVLLQIDALWLSNEQKIRLVSLIGAPFWFVYNTLSHAYGSSVGDVLSMCSMIIGMIRYRKAGEQDGEGAEK